jgi:hypothetical protein
MLGVPNIDCRPWAAGAVLFGSHARGDSDAYSDIDLAIFVMANDINELAGIKTDMAEESEKRVSISLYSTRTAEILARDGSLFLWHLSLEGRILFQRDGWMSALFSRLKPYGKNKALRDLTTFARLLEDCRHALCVGNSTAPFEAATMYSVLRNCSMIYSHMNGMPCFGRLQPIRLLAQRMGRGFPLSEPEVLTLEALRLAYTRRPARSLAPVDVGWCLAICSGTVQVLDFVRRSIDGRES